MKESKNKSWLWKSKTIEMNEEVIENANRKNLRKKVKMKRLNFEDWNKIKWEKKERRYNREREWKERQNARKKEEKESKNKDFKKEIKKEI